MKTLMQAIAWMALLLMTLRGIKYTLGGEAALARYVWYLYYVPLLLITGTMPQLNGHDPVGFPESLCFMAAGVLDVCIQLGLIPTNEGYGRLFRLCSLSAQITDLAGTPVYASAAAAPLTPAAVKLCADRMPCGICYWRTSGQVIFSNHCMDRLCAVLTGDPLLNGNSFYEAVPEGIVTVDDRAWRFSTRELTFDHGPLHEMIAADVTGEYAKIQALQEDIRELSHINQELRAYRAEIEDSVRRQEILQAKVNIHDEMNRLLLSIVTADKSGRAELLAEATETFRLCLRFPK